ncbi:manganese efflux pump MntP family protein [uncultured Methanoregula sp.]|uniref:manganese efflux pump MntP n=1 Tax=uncultured Methanoregula sp. TaxID=1005933 RepID=UPI002AAA76B0|nr:manganese efflux pump MntP family protein [uncultured Methanoregula sp.]
MDLVTPLIIGIGLSMDCFAVSLALGTTTKSRLLSIAAYVALFFGVFQAGMTLAGWVAGAAFFGLISIYAPWIAFLLLAIIGGRMCHEGLRGGEESHPDSLQLVPVIILSLATSIDALAVGVTFGIMGTPVLLPAIIIGTVCFLISFAGVMLGERLEDILGNRIEIAGGIILILTGLKILAESVFF